MTLEEAAQLKADPAEGDGPSVVGLIHLAPSSGLIDILVAQKESPLAGVCLIAYGHQLDYREVNLYEARSDSRTRKAYLGTQLEQHRGVKTHLAGVVQDANARWQHWNAFEIGLEELREASPIEHWFKKQQLKLQYSLKALASFTTLRRELRKQRHVEERNLAQYEVARSAVEEGQRFLATFGTVMRSGAALGPAAPEEEAMNEELVSLSKDIQYFYRRLETLSGKWMDIWDRTHDLFYR